MMPAFRRPNKNAVEVASDQVIWGVARREGASDRDDPLLHSGLMQHAFLFGVDDEAICGFRPPARVGFVGTAKMPQLAMPPRESPRCPKCAGLLVSASTPSEALDLDSTDTDAQTVEEVPDPVD